MIIWINGAFGSGKTTTAGLVTKRLDGAKLFDPECDQHPTSRRDPLQVATTGAHQAAQQDFCWAPAGTQLSVNKDFSLSASRRWGEQATSACGNASSGQPLQLHQLLTERPRYSAAAATFVATISPQVRPR
jgi:hypothetical protein